jgi:hypothetical protein
MTTKTFRGQLADGDIERIRLGTNNGLTGYKIKKFELFPAQQDSAKDSLVCLHSVKPDSATTSANFDSPTLLAAAVLFNGTYEVQNIVVFDNVKFNQDVYVTHVDSIGSNAMNFYLELEQVKLSLDEATVATLKDMRGNYTNQAP